MMKIAPVELSSCPHALQEAVHQKLSDQGGEILSVTLTESTPFKDKSVVSRQYRVIINRQNLVSVLHCYNDGILKDQVSTNELIWGDILEIIRTAPDGSSLAALRQAVPERERKLLSL